MEYKPDHDELISYLYGEIGEKEKLKLEKYFLQNPKELTRLKELQVVRDLMGNLRDKEVITPPVFVDHEYKPTFKLWQYSQVKIAFGIAAAFLIMILGAKILGMELSYSKGELILSFHKIQKEASPFTREDAQQLIYATLAKNEEKTALTLAKNKELFDEFAKNTLTQNTKNINELVKSASSASQNDIRQVITGLRDENIKVLRDYMKLSTDDQKQYIEGLLVDFSKYIREQRNQDLQLVETRLNEIEQNNNQFRQEAGQILTSLISTNNSSIKRN